MRKPRKQEDVSPILREGLRRLEVPEASAGFDDRVIGAVTAALHERRREANREVGTVMAIALLAACVWAVYLLPLVSHGAMPTRIVARPSLESGHLSTFLSDPEPLSNPTGYATLNCGTQ